MPAKNAYLPHVVGGDDPRTDTWQMVDLSGDHVTMYTVNTAPMSQSQAVVRARQELPTDATLLWSGIVSGGCDQAEWKSPTLAQVLGNGYVNVEFDNAATADNTPVTEELFGDQVAPTPAQAPAC